MMFGDIVFYCAPNTFAVKPCVYLRQEGGKHVVMFENADWAARVGPNCLRTAAEIEDEGISKQRAIDVDLSKNFDV